MPIPLAIPIALAATSVMSSIFGASKSASANEAAQAQLAAEKAKTQAERRRKMNEDYIDTASGQNMIRQARQEADRIWKREQGAAAVSGATDANTQMAKDAGNQMVGNAIANIAANDTARKDNIDAQYRQEERAITQQQIANQQQKGQIIAQAASGVGSALMQAAGATFGGTKLGMSMMGAGSPGGLGVTSTPQQTTQLQNMAGGTQNLYDMHPDIQRQWAMQNYGTLFGQPIKYHPAER